MGVKRAWCSLVPRPFLPSVSKHRRQKNWEQGWKMSVTRNLQFHAKFKVFPRIFTTFSTTHGNVISCADSSETLPVSGKTPSKESPSPPSDASTGPSPPQSDSGSLDVAYFRKIHSDVTARLTELCQEWEEKSASLEEQEDISEDGRDTVVA